MKRIYVKEEWCLGCHFCEYLGSIVFEQLKKTVTFTAFPAEKRKQYFGGVV